MRKITVLDRGKYLHSDRYYSLDDCHSEERWTEDELSTRACEREAVRAERHGDEAHARAWHNTASAAIRFDAGLRMEA